MTRRSRRPTDDDPSEGQGAGTAIIRINAADTDLASLMAWTAAGKWCVITGDGRDLAVIAPPDLLDPAWTALQLERLRPEFAAIDRLAAGLTWPQAAPTRP